MKRAKKGFTLIEVICVLVIIAIVAVIAVPSISKYIDNSKIGNCKSTMNNFINDLEYKIVSKRFYDVDELNGELVKYVEANADSLNSVPDVVSTDGKFVSLTENITEATGVCPNGGHYSIKWIITPGGEENPNTARVKLESCVCDCMKDAEKNVQLNSAHEFTAALITRSDYLKSSATEDENYREEIQKIVDYINGRLNDNNDINDPSRIDDIIRDYEELHKDDPVKYVIRGATVKENRPGSGNDNWVEWISVSLQTDYPANGKDVYKFITYYPERKDGSSTPGTGNVFQSGDADGKLVIREIETESGNDPDRKDWPPVEGTSGSYYYLKDFNYANNKNYQIADINNADIIQFIQRDTNWYVQKTNSTAGINSINSIAENAKDGYPLVSNDWLKDGETLDITNEEALNVYMNPNISNADFRDIFLVQPQYNNGSKTEFGHLKASDLTKDNPNDYFISNGYILVSSPDAVKDKDGNIINWAGIWAEEYDADGNKIENSERETLKQLLREEDQIVSDVFRAVSTGDYGEDGRYEITVAYQEYYKNYDEVKAYTNFGTIRIYPPADPSEDAVIKSVGNNGTETAIGYISIKDVTGSYNINVKNTSSDGKFSTADLEITKKVTYTVKDTAGNVKCKETEVVTLKAGVDYYIGTEADIESGQNKTNESIEAINKGITSGTSYFIYLPGKGDKLGEIKAGNVKTDTLKWEYNKGENDKTFDLNKISVWYEYPILITDLTVTPNKTVEYSVSKQSFKHKTSDSENGWYLVEKGSSDDKNNKYNKKNEEAILKKINDVESDAIVKLYKKNDSNINNKKLFNIQTRIESLSETHEIQKVEKHSHGSFLDWLDNLISRFTGSFGSAFSGNDFAIGLNVKANYGIKVVHIETGDTSIIHFNVDLNHDTTTHWYTSEIDFNYRRFFVYNGSTASISYNMEQDYIDGLKSTYDGDVYIYYTDNYSQNKYESTKYNFNNYTKFHFMLYKVPDFVYYRDAGDGLDVFNWFSEDEMHIEGYIGNDTTINIPATVEGRWEYFNPGGNSIPVNFKGETIYYVPDGKTYQVDRVGKGYQKIGQTVDEYKFVFEDENVKNHLVSINIAEGIKEVDDYAFAGLGELESISLPSSLEKIDVHAFEGVTLKGNSSNYEFVIPENVKEIYQYAFKDFTVNGTLRINGYAYNGLQSNIRDDIAIGYYNKAILPRRFDGAKFKKLVFGPNVQTIEEGAFAGNTSAASLDLGSVKTIYKNAFSNWNNATGSLVIPKTVTGIGKDAFVNFASSVKGANNYPSLTVMGGTSVSTLDGAIFAGSHFDNVTIGGNVSSIKKSSFSNVEDKYSGFTGTLRIENSVSSIGESAFEGCTGFSGSLILPRNQQFKTIYSKAFMGCSGFTGDLDIPSSVTTIEDQAFEGCSGFNGTLNLGNRISSIKGSAFKDCSGFTGNLVIPESVTSMGTFAFERYAADANGVDNYPSLTVYGGSNGTILSSGIFINSHFKNVTIGGNVKKIDGLAFRNAPLKNEMPYDEFKGELKIQDSVTTIGKAAFENCTGFDSLVFSDDSELVSIGDAAFSRCWFKGSLDIPSKVTSIGSRAFNDCVGFDGNLSLNYGLKKIGMEAFRNCINLAGNVTIPETVTDGIGNCAFENFGQNVSDSSGRIGRLEINAGSFAEGKKITAFIFTGAKFNGLSIGGIVEEIDTSAFHDDNSDEVDPVPDEEKIPEYLNDKDATKMPEKKDVLRADYSRFTGSLTIGDSVKVVGTSAFENLKVTSLSGMRNVVSVGSKAFKNCTRMSAELTFGDEPYSIETIGEEAFYGDSSLGSVSIPPSVTTIGKSAFDYSGSGGQLVIFGSSGKDSKGRRLLGNENIGDMDTLFRGANYHNVYIGGNVEVIGPRFMKHFVDNEYDYSYKDVTGNLTISGNVKEIGAEAFNGTGFDGELKLESIELKTIRFSAFENLKNMRGSLTIPASVTSIDVRAFKKFASEGNKNYSEDNKPKLIIKGYSESNGDDKIIGYRIFSYARFDTVEIGGADSTVNTIGDYAFYNSNVDHTVGATGDATFEGHQHNFEGVSAEAKDYKTIFDGSGIVDNSFQINNDTSHYVDFTKNVKILDGIKSIGIRAFGDDYSIENVDLSEASSLTTIREDAFNRCTNAGGGLTIPKTVSSIGRCAFKQFGQNTDNPGTLKIYGYSDSSKDGTIKYIGMPLEDMNSDSKPIFPSAKFKDVIIGGTAEEAEVNAISDKFMNSQRADDITYNYTNITGSLTIGESITEIGREAFLCCSGFNGQLVLNNGLVSIGENAFNACSGFNGDLIIPETVTSIGSYAFKHFGQADGSRDNENKGSLTVLGYSSMKEGLKTIDAHIFDHAHFRNITIGGNVEKIADNFMDNSITETFDNGNTVPMFNGVRGDITIKDDVTEIGDKAFYRCSNLKGRLTLNDGLNSIGVQAFAETQFFEEAEGEKNLTIPSTVTYIGRSAFEKFCYNSNNPPSLTILGYSSSDEQGGIRKIGSELFDYSSFRDVTIGGNVYCVDGVAFNDVGKYQGWSGMLKFEPNSVGYAYGSYHNTAMSYGDNWGPFHGCKFEKVILPEGLYNALRRENDYFTKFGLYGNANIPVEFAS